MTSPIRVQRTLKAQFEAGDSREETLLGRDYYVVPVIAMVEGVRLGANQTGPELGLAAEFGDVPIAWANRPLVLNHPQTEDGDFVSANSPSIIQSWAFGLTMNPEIDDDKLRMEAWIDVQRVEELGGDFETTFQRIKDQEEVEVSVGFFSDILKQKGVFKGQKYDAVWKNIKPDHLAVLTEGITGACSVKDGCGIPRINERGQVMSDSKLKTDSCGCGGSEPSTCTCNESTEPKTHKKGSVPSVQSQSPLEPELDETLVEQRQQNQEIVDLYLKVNKVDTSMFSGDVQKLLQRALRKEFGYGTYLYGYTGDKAIYESYNSNDYSFVIKQIGINVKDDKVTFVGEAEEVVLLTKIVPQVGAPTLTGQQENAMSTTNNQSTENPTTPEVKSEPITQASNPTPPETPKPMTVQSYIEQAPEEMREVLQSSMKLHQKQKDTHIATLKAHKSNKFSDDELKTMSLETLDKMVALLPGSYSGVATPADISTQSSGDSGIVEAPRVFTFNRDKSAA